jgi:hypothetical protein
MVGSSFLGLSIVSLAFSLIFYLKSRAVKKISKGLAATVFDRTFAVFDSFPERRRTIRSDFFFFLLSPLMSFVWAFIIVFVVLLPIIEAGFVGDLAILVLALGPMMVSEATEAYSCANTLTKAAERHSSFGRGDISILLILKKTIGKMSAYYLVLSVLFAALFLAAPYVFSPTIFACSLFVGLILNATIGIPIIAPFAAAFLFILFALAIFEAAKRVKAALFGFSTSDLSDSETRDEAVMARWILHEH